MDIIERKQYNNGSYMQQKRKTDENNIVNKIKRHLKSMQNLKDGNLKKIY